LGHAGHDAQYRTTFKSQHAGAGFSVELLADFGDDSTPSKKAVLKTTCRQTLGSKHRFALILPSTVAPHALRHRLPHHDSRAAGAIALATSLQADTPAVAAPKR
jgi:hypothetical protein